MGALLRPEAADVVSLLKLEQVTDNVFMSVSGRDEPNILYGGQVVAQGLMAAGLTVEGARRPHSFHAYFLAPGNPKNPVHYSVDIDRNGRSYSFRRVTAHQDGVVILVLSAVFVEPDEVVDVAVERPARPGVGCMTHLRVEEVPRLLSFEGRRADDERPAESRLWTRCLVDPGESPLLQACLAAYQADTLSSSFLSAHPELVWGPAIDYSMWFHARVDVAGWLVTSKSVVQAGGGLGLFSGSVFSPDGEQVAALTQQVLRRAKTFG